MLTIAFPVLLLLLGNTAPAPVQRALPLKILTACQAVTRAEVEEALGVAVGKGREETAGLQSSCDYAAGSGQVTVTLQRLVAKLDLPYEMKSLKAAVPEGRVREAAGIAALAFFLDIPGAGTQLHVLRGQREYLMISILGFGEAGKVSAASETLARGALGRL